MKRLFSFAWVILLVGSGVGFSQQNKGIYHDGWIDLNKNGKKDVYEDPSAPVEARIKDLLSQMTLDEKTCQLATLYGYHKVLQDELPTPGWKNEIWKDGIANIDEHLNGVRKISRYSYPFSRHAEAINTVQRFFIEETRLGIPVDFTDEGIRGICHYKATYFPAQIGVASAWDWLLVRKIGEVTGAEAKALGYTNVYSPILGLGRDPRWGRIVETYGEDPYLVSRLGKQEVLGLQSQGVASTAKHYAVYSVPVGGRDGGSRTDPHQTPRAVWSLFLEPFRVDFTEAHGLGVMSSYNDYNGIPITGSHYFLTTVLRQKFGFKGYVVSDSDALEYLFTKHKVSPTYEDAIARAYNAGLNVRTTFTKPEVFIIPLRKAVRDGKISEATIDQRVSDVLRVKFLLGLFDHPYVKDPAAADKIVHSDAHKKLALQAAHESMILLKNEGGLLPLKKTLKTVAVIGPDIEEVKQISSRYGPRDPELITVLEGIRQEVSPATRVLHAKGCTLTDPHFPESDLYSFPMTADEKKMIDEAVRIAKKADVAIMVLGGDNRTCREGRSRTSLDLTGRQRDLIQAVYHTGTPVVLVLMNGRPLTINWCAAHVPAIVEAWFPGEFTGKAIADVLFGDYNPGGKLPVTFPKSVGQIPYAFPYIPGARSKGITRVSGALFPFGYGLSYTTFAYSGLSIDPDTAGLLNNVKVSFTVQNTGKRPGDEVAQLYINDVVSSVITYEKVLRGFERIHLKPGEKKTVTFTLTPRDLGFYGKDMEFTVEPGRFDVFVGSSSEDIRLKGSFSLVNRKGINGIYKQR